MSFEAEGRNPTDNGSAEFDIALKKSKLLYSREFLLSLSNLDICKKLPSGFDKSLISEFEDASQFTSDRPRFAGSLPLQSFRRSEYGSSPPIQGDSGNYSRGFHGKWESRSSGRSDRDNDAQPDRDPDSGRRFGPQYRLSWQTPEHDGLLGSGSFAKPTEYTPGSKVRANEQYQLSKSNEPYQPPRPYKAVPHSRKDTDSFNDETFGSIECNSEDRAEEEKRRRASFEMMRKEQQKALQEKQKLKNNSKEEKGLFFGNDELEVSGAIPILSTDLEENSFVASHSPASRPVVPPGFKNNTLEKSSGLKSMVHPSLSEVGKPVTEESLLNAESNLIQSGIDQSLSQEISIVNEKPNKGENMNLRLSLEVPTKKMDIKDQLPRFSGHIDSHEKFDNPGIFNLNAKVLEDKTIDSTSILENFFGSTLSKHDSGSSSAGDSKANDIRGPDPVQSSKFAQWFFEEESKPSDNFSPVETNDLMSLIVSGDKGKYPLEESTKLKVNNMPSEAANISSVLTCEDLEQSILSEYSSKSTTPQAWSTTDANTKQVPQSTRVDGHASLHLLSLLHKGADESNTTLNTDGTPVSQENDKGKSVNSLRREETSKNVPDSVNPLTLETLFGTAFMKELRGSMGSARVDPPEPHKLPFPVTDDNNYNNNMNSSPKIGFKKPSHMAENWRGFDDSQMEITSSKHHHTGNLRNNANFSWNEPGDIMDTREEQVINPPSFTRNPYEQLEPEIPYRNFSSQMKFLKPDPMFSNNASSSLNHQFPSNIIRPPFPNPNVRVAGFEVPSGHSMVHQRQMSGNHIPQRLTEFQRVGLGSGHGNQVNGFMQEMNQMQSYPFGPHPPNIGVQGVPIQDRDFPSLGDPPEALQRLIELELRTKSNQPRPMAPPGQYNQGIDGHEVGMGFRYR